MISIWQGYWFLESCKHIKLTLLYKYTYNIFVKIVF